LCIRIGRDGRGGVPSDNTTIKKPAKSSVDMQPEEDIKDDSEDRGATSNIGKKRRNHDIRENKHKSGFPLKMRRRDTEMPEGQKKAVVKELPFIRDDDFIAYERDRDESTQKLNAMPI
jgi:hypothetical protein